MLPVKDGEKIHRTMTGSLFHPWQGLLLSVMSPTKHGTLFFIVIERVLGVRADFFNPFLLL